MSDSLLPRLVPVDAGWRDRRAVLTGQLVFTAMYAMGFLLGLLPSVDFADAEFAVVGAVVTVVALGLAVGLPRTRWSAPTATLLPFLDVAAILLLERGAADHAVLLNGLVLVPVVILAWLGGLRGAALATLASVIASYTPVLWVDELADPAGTVVRSAFFPVICLALAVFVAQVADTTRAGAIELSRLADELRASRDTMAGLIDAATEQAIIGTDADGRIEFFNRGAERQTGWTATEVRGRSVLDLALPAEIDALVGRSATTPRPGETPERARWRGALGEAAHGGVREVDLTLVRRGEVVGASHVVVTRRGGAGDRGYLVIASDVTREREIEQAKSRFIGYVSHELRTPISSVLGYLELLDLDGDGLTAEQRGHLEVIDRNARRLLHLVDDLLLTAQVDSGNFTVHRQPTDLRDVVAAAARSAAPTAAAAGIELVDDDTGPVPLHGDPVRLAQAVDNLVSNALKFTPSGGAVTLRAERVGDDARLTVQDTGPGIAPEDLQHLTERFYRSRRVNRERVPGVGLGLAITQAIVDAHGGTMRVDSVVGRGTTFTVTLPTAPG
ncbi:ATP-binding protein [Isoptericola jiangsuensis]|uniref:ATP-binding protein n=1 Tax=Isoptericola jiangsuensis TaxID=548579 RepID=UPI00114564DE|nr:ATP-binding protein [Isoptericola jiangsuensis]